MAGIWDLSYCGADRWHLRLSCRKWKFCVAYTPGCHRPEAMQQKCCNRWHRL